MTSLMTRTRNPWSLLPAEVERLFDVWPNWLGQGTLSPGAWFPMDLTETQNEYVIVAEIPGVPKDNVDVSLEENVLTIHVNKPAPEVGEDDSVHTRERVFGEFRRSLRLPRDVDVDRVKAQHRDGLLEIRLPKREESKPKQIAIK
jgi:HSP20 family protein